MLHNLIKKMKKQLLARKIFFTFGGTWHTAEKMPIFLKMIMYVAPHRQKYGNEPAIDHCDLPLSSWGLGIFSNGDKFEVIS